MTHSPTSKTQNNIYIDDLNPKEEYISILKRIEFWKKKVDEKQQRMVY
jgi:hypothetical protein